METGLAFWLCPDSGSSEYFQNLINYYSDLLNSPSYPPHLTLFYGKLEKKDSIENIINKAKTILKKVTLDSTKIDYSDNFPTSFFVQFELNNEIANLSSKIGSFYNNPGIYNLSPHLSLFYKNGVSKSKKEDFRKQIELPFKQVTFNKVKVITSNFKVEEEKDIQSFQYHASIEVK